MPPADKMTSVRHAGERVRDSFADAQDADRSKFLTLETEMGFVPIMWAIMGCVVSLYGRRNHFCGESGTE